MNIKLTSFSKSIFLILLAVFYSNVYLSQNKKRSPINDFSFTLHEETVNKVLATLGEISGSSDFEVLLIKGTYTWTIINPKINIRPDSSYFTCDAIVKTGFFEYKSKVVGNVKIDYLDANNTIYIKISRAVFELYTVVLSKKIHIRDIHLEDKFKEPFAFSGPRAFRTTLDFPLPDSTSKRIVLQPTECKMEVRWKEIATSCEIKAEEILLDKSVIIVNDNGNVNSGKAGTEKK